MIRSINKNCRLNSSLTDRVIELHNSGYEMDFHVLNEQQCICIQDGRKFCFEEVLVKIIDQVFDTISCSYKYIHTIDTDCGCKGLLIIDSIVIKCDAIKQHIDMNYLTGQLSA